MSVAMCFEEVCRRGLRDDAARIFASDGGPTKIFQFGELQTKQYAIQSNVLPRSQIMSMAPKDQDALYLIKQEFTFGPLQTTLKDLNEIMSYECISPRYLPLLEAFGTRITDSSITGLYTFQRLSETIDEERLAELAYNIPFPELNGRHRGCPWSQRLLGVYHQVNVQNFRSCWILIQAHQSSHDAALKDAQATSRLSDRTLDVHLSLWLSTESHWSEYVEYLSGITNELDEKASFSRLKLSCENDYLVSSSDFQQVHNIKKKVKKALADLETTQNITVEYVRWCNRIMARSESGEIVSETLDGYKRKIATHKKNVATIFEQLEEIGDLIKDVVSFRDIEVLRHTNRAMQSNLAALQDIGVQNQRENETLARIAKKTQKDSTALKTLTFIATIYLPATFVATIFSSNLIPMTTTQSSNGLQTSEHFSISSQFWVYALITLALMVITMIVFVGVNRRLAIYHA